MKNQYDYLNDVKTDFSLYEEEPMSKEEIKAMTDNIKTKKKFSKRLVVTAAAAAVIAISTAAAASAGYFDGIIKTISTGHNTFVQVDPNAPYELPDALMGKLFDKDGNALTTLTKGSLSSLYDANGNLLTQNQLKDMLQEALGDEIYLYDEASLASEVSYSTIEEAETVISFDLKVPNYIPDRFTFTRAYNYGGGESDDYYMNLEYTDKDGNIMYVMERLINDEAAFTACTDGKLEETTINGRPAVITNDSSIAFETEDNVSVDILSRGNLTKDELIKMAESIK